MKTPLGLLVVSLICGWNNSSLANEARGGSGLTWKFQGGLPNGDVTYAFDVRMTEKDRWNPASQDTPPFLPGKAIQLAKDFMRKVPLGKGWSMWQMNTVRLLRSEDMEGLEEWLYVIDFYAANPRQGRSGPPDMSIPVRMDGTIPEPIIVAYSAGDEVETNLTKQISGILTECKKITVGTTRAELLKVFTTEGGLSTATHRTFVHRRSPYIKVEVDFSLSDPKQKDELPSDTVSKISKPYLEWSIID